MTADELLVKLDTIAREYDVYDYGLPVHNPEVLEKMREAVHEFEEQS